MSDTPWTPGPWTVVQTGPSDWAVDDAGGHYHSGPHAEADARLIAAAPEMAEMVAEYASLVHSDYCGVREHARCVEARVLLARIRGES